jgi:hypothetical protein
MHSLQVTYTWDAISPLDFDEYNFWTSSGGGALGLGGGGREPGSSVDVLIRKRLRAFHRCEVATRTRSMR